MAPWHRDHWALAQLLLAMRPLSPTQVERLRALATPANDEATTALLRRWRTTRRAAICGAAEELSLPALQAAADHARLASAGGGIQQLISRQIQQNLHASGIRSVVLKGPAMATRLHGSGEARGDSADIDLLVAPADLDAARRQIEALGWLPPDDLVDHAGLPIRHFHLDAAGRGVPSVDLHWRAHWYDGGVVFSEGILSRAADSDGLVVPDAIDDLVVLLTSFIRDGFEGLRLPGDIAAWWELADDEGTAAKQVCERCSPFPELWGAMLVASAVCSAVVGTPTLTEAIPRGSRVVARVTARLSREPLSLQLELAKRTLIDAAAAPQDLSARWPAVWLPRRARFVRAATCVGQALHRILVGPSQAH